MLFPLLVVLTAAPAAVDAGAPAAEPGAPAAGTAAGVGRIIVLASEMAERDGILAARSRQTTALPLQLSRS